MNLNNYVSIEVDGLSENNVLPIKTQWEQLCDSIDKLELEINETDFPIPTRQMCEYLIVGEDHRFYRHLGVDLFALCRAPLENLFLWCKAGRFNNRDAVC